MFKKCDEVQYHNKDVKIPLLEALKAVANGTYEFLKIENISDGMMTLKSKYPNIKFEYNYSTNIIECSVFVRSCNYQELKRIVMGNFKSKSIAGTLNKVNSLGLIEFGFNPIHAGKIELIKDLIEA